MNNKNRVQNLNIRLKEETKKQLKKIARKRKLNLTRAVISLIEDEVERLKKIVEKKKDFKD